MYVCICKGVTERDVQCAVADGCTSLRELRSELGVTSGCGKCACHARRVLGEALCARSVAPQVGYFTPQPLAV